MAAKRMRLGVARSSETAPSFRLTDDEIKAVMERPRLFWESPLMSRMGAVLLAARRENVEASSVCRGLLHDGLGCSFRASLATQASALEKGQWEMKHRMLSSA
eukprot:4892066-Pyramimonas_sp.AAC.1